MPTSKATLDLSKVPLEHHELLTSAVDQARQTLEGGGKVAQRLLIDAPRVDSPIAVDIRVDDQELRDQDIEHAHRLAGMQNSRWVLQVSESWALPPNQVHLHEDIMAKYGSLANYRHRRDVLSIILETVDRYYVATPAIVPKGLSKNRRTLGPVAFMAADRESRGALAGFVSQDPAR